jgi:hypothetical protein
MITRLFVGVACTVGVLLQGCAASPYPELVGQRYFVTNIDTYPVLISSVDGKSSVTVPVRVDPGIRRITVQGTPGGAGVSDLETFTLDVKPCTRYYIVAVKASPLESRFTPRIDFEQALAGCTAPPP